MSDLLSYKGYQGSVEYSAEDKVLHGRVLFIKSMLSYHGSDVVELTNNFMASIDRYLEHCSRMGVDPNKPFSGTFNVRIGPDRHRSLAVIAAKGNRSINEVLCEAVNHYLGENGQESSKKVMVTFSPGRWHGGGHAISDELMMLSCVESVSSVDSLPQVEEWAPVVTGGSRRIEERRDVKRSRH